MSLKALARQWRERNAPCNPPCNLLESPATTCATDADGLAERAARIHEGAAVPIEWAEGFARLEAQPVPHGVDGGAWLAMIDAAGRFLDQWGSKAAALGWTAAELFGLDDASPIQRRDRRGAAFYLAGAEVVALSADEIAFRLGGSIQRLRRRDVSSAAAWEALP